MPKVIPSISLKEDHTDEDASASTATANSDDDEEEESGDPEDFYDVLDVLDGKTDINEDQSLQTDTLESHEGLKSSGQTASAIKGAKTRAHVATDSESENGDTDTNDDALLKLGTFISGLPTSGKRKADDAEIDSAEPVRRKRVAFMDKTEHGVEGDYVQSGGMST